MDAYIIEKKKYFYIICYYKSDTGSTVNNLNSWKWMHV